MKPTLSLHECSMRQLRSQIFLFGYDVHRVIQTSPNLLFMLIGPRNALVDYIRCAVQCFTNMSDGTRTQRQHLLGQSLQSQHFAPTSQTFGFDHGSTSNTNHIYSKGEVRIIFVFLVMLFLIFMLVASCMFT